MYLTISNLRCGIDAAAHIVGPADSVERIARWMVRARAWTTAIISMAQAYEPLDDRKPLLMECSNDFNRYRLRYQIKNIGGV
jgi:hypothetical protein